jgi:DUF1707 SHOCT-like domain
MAEPPGQMPAAAGRGHLRTSNADRENAIGTLKAAFVQGRLAKDEFDLRVGQALVSRTYAELAAVTGDLPAGLAEAQLPEAARVRRQRPILRRPGVALTAATVFYLGLWPVAAALPKTSGEGYPSDGVNLIGSATLFYVLVLSLIGLWAQALRSRQDEGPGGPIYRRTKRS